MTGEGDETRAVSLDQALAIGLGHHQAGRLIEAESIYRQILAAVPNQPDASDLLGLLLLTRGDLHGAHAHILAAIEQRPTVARFHNDLGTVFLQAGQGEDAIHAFSTAARLDPKMAEAQFNLGLAHQMEGDMRAARAAHQAALALQPTMPQAELAAVVTALPVIPADAAEEAASRRHYAEALAALDRTWRADPAHLAAGASAIGSQQPFYLPYQGQSDRDLQAQLGALMVDALVAADPQSLLTAAELAVPAEVRRASRAARPMRVAIVAAHLRRHSVWNAITRGWVSELPSRGVEVHLFGTAPGVDDETRWAAERVASIDLEGKTRRGWAEAIRAREPDVVIFPELGIDPMALMLAATPLAPVQAVAWGHPQTSGLPTISHFLSGALLEPADGADHYTEQLVPLPNLGVWLEAPEWRVTPAARADHALPTDRVLIACPHSLFKHRPERDAVLVAIAQQAPSALMVFFAHRSEHVTTAFRLRLDRAFTEAGLLLEEHVMILPRLSLAEFRHVLAAADLALDSMDFAGFNTAIEAMVAGLPLVTHAGGLMRGRFGAALLMRMGLDSLIAQTPEAVVARVAGLVASARERREEGLSIQAALPRIARDHAAIDGLMAWFESVV
ncbi:MAG: tetratricopeptide repeat protein [Alphaproteobacteria bacterium]|nr:tetratricopeptide repeat protein [Alphaproteobacteria bacterium]